MGNVAEDASAGSRLNCYSLHPMSRGCRAAAAAISFLVVSTALAGEPPADDPTADLSARLDRIEATLARLESARDPARWLNDRRAAAIRTLVQDILADAESRAAQLDDGSGWDKGFVVRSDDGNFLIRANLLFQLRFAFNHRNHDTSDGTRWGFEVRRARIIASGHIVDPTLTYKMSVALTTGQIRDAYINKNLGGGFELRAGQFKLPFLREFLVSATKQQAAQRSLIAASDNAGRSEGVQVSYQGERWRFAGALSDGLNATGIPSLSPDTRIAVTGRVEFVAAGEWSRFAALTSPPESGTGVLLGGAVHYQKRDAGAPLIHTQQLLWTADVSIQLGGANLFGYVVGNRLSGDGVTPDATRLAVVLQGGVYVTPIWEVFGRYEWAKPDTVGESDLSLLTAGFNCYLHGQQLRWTTDVGVGLKPVSATFANGSANWLEDQPGRDGQVVVRSQFQLLF